MDSLDATNAIANQNIVVFKQQQACVFRSLMVIVGINATVKINQRNHGLPNTNNTIHGWMSLRSLHDLRYIQGDYPDMFIELFPELDFEVFNVYQGHFPDDVNDYEAYITNGSRLSVYDKVDWIIRLKAFVREIYLAKKKYVGVCFGHQLLAEALGGKVAKAESGWSVGVHRLSVLQREKWMMPYQTNLNLLMMCQDQVQVLPEGGEVLAQTDVCPVGVFKVGGHMLGVQAHPEFSKKYDQALMELRLERMGTEVVNAGIASLQQPVDKNIIAQWILQFLYF